MFYAPMHEYGETPAVARCCIADQISNQETRGLAFLYVDCLE